MVVQEPTDRTVSFMHIGDAQAIDLFWLSRYHRETPMRRIPFSRSDMRTTGRFGIRSEYLPARAVDDDLAQSTAPARKLGQLEATEQRDLDERQDDAEAGGSGENTGHS